MMKIVKESKFFWISKINAKEVIIFVYLKISNHFRINQK